MGGLFLFAGPNGKRQSASQTEHLLSVQLRSDLQDCPRPHCSRSHSCHGHSSLVRWPHLVRMPVLEVEIDNRRVSPSNMYNTCKAITTLPDLARLGFRVRGKELRAKSGRLLTSWNKTVPGSSKWEGRVQGQVQTSTTQQFERQPRIEVGPWRPEPGLTASLRPRGRSRKEMEM